MTPGQYQFVVTRGDRESIGVRLATRDVFTNVLRYIYLHDKTVTFTVSAPGKPPVVRTWTVTSSGGLSVDLDTAQVLYPLTEQDTLALEPGDGNTFSVRVVDANGDGGTYLVGSILAR